MNYRQGTSCGPNQPVTRTDCHSVLRSITLAMIACLTLNTSAPAGDDTKPAAPSIFETARSAVAKKEVVRSPLVGSETEEITFREASSDGGILVGFEVGVDKFLSSYIVRALRPIYRSQTGTSVSREYGGRAKPKPVSRRNPQPQEELKWVTLQAKPGYAVGRINLCLGLNIQGISLTFLKINGSWLDRGDMYDSPWAGSNHRGRKAAISSDGAPIVGVRGHHDEEKVLALGLVYLKEVAEPEEKPAKPAAKADELAQEGAPTESAPPPLDSFRNAPHHYNFILPKGWMAMPAKELDQVHSFANRLMPSQKITYDTGFRRGFPARPFEFPYVLVQSVPLPPGTINYDEIEQTLKQQLPGALKQASGALGDLARNMAFNSAVVDRDRNLIVLRMQMSANGRTAEGLSVGHLGSTHVVFLHCYALDKDFERYLTTFTEMNNSFYFDEGFAFKPEPPQPKGAVSNLMMPVLVGIGITGLVVGAFFVVQLKGSAPKPVVLEPEEE